VEDFLLWEASRMMGAGEPVLEGVERAIELLLTLRSRAGAAGRAGGDGLVSFSGNKENQFPVAMEASRGSAWNSGEVSKLSFM
jgi:hypothetical protein